MPPGSSLVLNGRLGDPNVIMSGFSPPCFVFGRDGMSTLIQSLVTDRRSSSQPSPPPFRRPFRMNNPNHFDEALFRSGCPSSLRRYHHRSGIADRSEPKTRPPVAIGGLRDGRRTCD